MLKILVADTVSEFCAAVAETFEGRYAVFACENGKEALDIICKERPDIVWLELVLPYTDGITVLKAVNRAGFYPKVIACARQLNHNVLDMLGNMGVCYFIRKPCALPAALSRIEDLAQLINSEKNGADASVEQLIYDSLLVLGLIGKHTGHRCLTAAIRLKVLDQSLLVTKTLYPAVVAECGGSVQSVERAIRREISTAWENREPSFWNLYFPEYSHKYPSNGVLIDRISDCIRETITSSEEHDCRAIKA